MRVNVKETDKIIRDIAERVMTLYRYPFSVNIKELGKQESAYSQNRKTMKLRFVEDCHFVGKLCPIIP